MPAGVRRLTARQVTDDLATEAIVAIVADNVPRPPTRPGHAATGPLPGSRPRKDPLGFRTAPVFILLLGDTRTRDFGPPGMQDDDRRWQFTFTSTLAIAYQHMHLAATSLGLATRWVSAVSSPAVEQRLKALLGIPEEFVVHDMMALGYSDFQPLPKELRAFLERLPTE